MLVLVVEGWDTDNHLVDQDSEGPPVKSMIVAGTYDHFWREVLGGSTERVRLFCVVTNDLCQTEVGKLHVAIDLK